MPCLKAVSGLPSWIALVSLGVVLYAACGSDETSTDLAGLSVQVAPITSNTEIEIMRDGKRVGALKAEYIPLDYPDMPWRGDPAIGMSSDEKKLRPVLFDEADIAADVQREYTVRVPRRKAAR